MNRILKTFPFTLTIAALLHLGAGTFLANELIDRIDFSGAKDSKGIPAPWELKVKTGKATTNTASDGQSFKFRSESASLSIQRKIDVNLLLFPKLNWRWKANRIPLLGDVRKSGRNDQALQIIVLFDSRRSISYVWDSNAPLGTLVDESIPFIMQVKVVVVQSGPDGLNQWHTFQRNVLEDFKVLYGEAPGSVKGIRYQSNTQYTNDISEGSFGDLHFSK